MKIRFKPSQHLPIMSHQTHQFFLPILKPAPACSLFNLFLGHKRLPWLRADSAQGETHMSKMSYERNGFLSLKAKMDPATFSGATATWIIDTPKKCKKTWYISFPNEKSTRSCRDHNEHRLFGQRKDFSVRHPNCTKFPPESPAICRPQMPGWISTREGGECQGVSRNRW